MWFRKNVFVRTGSNQRNKNRICKSKTYHSNSLYLQFNPRWNDLPLSVYGPAKYFYNKQCTYGINC